MTLCSDFTDYYFDRSKVDAMDRLYYSAQR